MINRQLKKSQRLLAFCLGLVMISCTKDANLVVTDPPPVDSSALVLFKGEFANGPYGAVRGGVEILKQDSAFVLSLKSFSSSSGPDLHVYLSREQQPVHFLDLGSLRSTTGNQLYRIPGRADLKEYPYALVHCQAYNHLFGHALLH